MTIAVCGLPTSFSTPWSISSHDFAVLDPRVGACP